MCCLDEMKKSNYGMPIRHCMFLVKIFPGLPHFKRDEEAGMDQVPRLELSGSASLNRSEEAGINQLSRQDLPGPGSLNRSGESDIGPVETAIRKPRGKRGLSGPM